MNFDFYGYYFILVVCGEVEVDRLTGDVVAHGVFHFKNGARPLDNVQIRGEVESQLTHEIFEVKDSFKGSFTPLLEC